jgi:hypothetical protein
MHRFDATLCSDLFYLPSDQTFTASTTVEGLLAELRLLKGTRSPCTMSPVEGFHINKVDYG